MLEWDLLSMKLRAAFIRNAVARGIYNVENIVLDYNEFRKGGPIETPIYEDLPKMLRKAGLNIKVTSGYRPAGTVGNAGLRSWHHRHGAVDIVPQGNTTFEDIENVLHNNPAIRQYMLSHNFGLIDESGRTPESVATMKKTGATGAHFHIGKDSKYAALYRLRVGAALPEGDRGKTVYFTNPFLPLEQPTQLALIQRTVTPEEILQSVVIPEPIKPDEDILATADIPEVEIIGHQPQVNPLTILSLIQESAPTPLALEPYLIPLILNKVNEIATERNSFLQKGLEDRLLAEERRRRLGYSYRDNSIEDDIKLILFLRNMSANGGNLYGGDNPNGQQMQIKKSPHVDLAINNPWLYNKLHPAENKKEEYEPTTFAGKVSQVVGGDDLTQKYVDYTSSVIQQVPGIGIVPSALDLGYDLNRMSHNPSINTTKDVVLDTASLLPALRKTLKGWWMKGNSGTFVTENGLTFINPRVASAIEVALQPYRTAVNTGIYASRAADFIDDSKAFLKDIYNDSTIGKHFPIKALGGSLSDSGYYEIMERVAKENNEKWNLLRALEGAPLLSVDEEYLRILNDNAYDYRGYYNKYPQSRANADTHWTDEFKTAFHPKFSVESKYSGLKSQYNPNGYLGGVWLKNGQFVPTFWQMNNLFALGGNLYGGTTPPTQKMVTYGKPYYTYDNNGNKVDDTLNYNATLPEILITPDSQKSPAERAVLERQRRRNQKDYDEARSTEWTATQLNKSNKEWNNSTQKKALEYAQAIASGVGMGADIVSHLPIYSSLKGASTFNRATTPEEYVESALWLSPVGGTVLKEGYNAAKPIASDVLNNISKLISRNPLPSYDYTDIINSGFYKNLVDTYGKEQAENIAKYISSSEGKEFLIGSSPRQALKLAKKHAKQMQFIEDVENAGGVLSGSGQLAKEGTVIREGLLHDLDFFVPKYKDALSSPVFDALGFRGENLLNTQLSIHNPTLFGTGYRPQWSKKVITDSDGFINIPQHKYGISADMFLHEEMPKTSEEIRKIIFDAKKRFGKPKHLQDIDNYKLYSSENPLIDLTTGQGQWNPTLFNKGIFTSEGYPYVQAVETYPGSGVRVPAVMNYKGEIKGFPKTDISNISKENATTVTDNQWTAAQDAGIVEMPSASAGLDFSSPLGNDTFTKFLYQNKINGKPMMRTDVMEFVNGEFVPILKEFADDVVKGLSPEAKEYLMYNTVERNIREFENAGYDAIMNQLYRDKVSKLLDDINVGRYTNEDYIKAGKIDIGGFYDKNRNFISINEGSGFPAKFVEKHEGRHLIDYNTSMLDELENILSKAYDDDFLNIPDTEFAGSLKDYKLMHKERVTTNRDARDVLLGDTYSKYDFTTQDKVIDKMPDERIFNAVEKANGYGRRYIKYLRANNKLTPEKAQQFREAMKHVGAVAAPVTAGATVYGASNQQALGGPLNIILDTNSYGGGGLMPGINIPAVTKNLYNKAKDRLYRTITPQGYHLGRAAKEFIKGDTRDFSKFTPAENEVWARYLGVPYEGESNFEKAVYSPTKGGATYDDVIKFKDESLILSDDALRQLLQNQMLTGKNTMLVEGNESGLGTYTLSLGEDENGKYISYYDDWDINPTRGLSAKYNIPIINLIGDIVPGSNPFTVYGRRYYTDEDLRRVIER